MIFEVFEVVITNLFNLKPRKISFRDKKMPQANSGAF
jgi:hypothetical protein